MAKEEVKTTKTEVKAEVKTETPKAEVKAETPKAEVKAEATPKNFYVEGYGNVTAKTAEEAGKKAKEIIAKIRGL